MKNKICFAVILVWNTTILFSQDFHLSQFDANPLYLNPALTGERMNAQKGVLFSANYRDQSAAYSKSSGSFNTIAVGVDVPMTKRLSIGQFIGNNRSVDGAFNSFNLLLSGSYKVISSKDDNDRQNLSVGLQAGLLNNSINTQSFTYASQYSPTSSTGFDNTLPTGEAYSQLSYYKFDYNFGVYYRTKLKNDKLVITSGFSIYHIGKKDETNALTSAVGMRTNFHASAIYSVNSKIKVTPQVLYMNQYKTDEFNMGVLMNYVLKENYEPIIGVNWVNKKAMVFQAGVKVKGTTFRMSYSTPLSYLRSYSNQAIEFSLIHTSNKHIQNSTSEGL